MTRGKESDLHAKSTVLYLRFSDDGKPPRISSSTKAGRRFDNLTHAPRRFAQENFTSDRRRRPISSSMFKVPSYPISLIIDCFSFSAIVTSW